MLLPEVIEAYHDAVFDTDRDRALGTVRRAVEAGTSPEDIIFEVVIPTVEKLMNTLSEDLDSNLARHFMSVQIASEVTEEMVPLFARPPEVIGRVVIGTARGDLHSLGKRIVTGCLRSLMIEAIDLGVNVAAERFVDEAVAHGAQVIGVSALMMHTACGEGGASAVRRLLASRGLEGKIKLVVGGAPFRFDTELYRTVGADAWAPDGVTAGRVITRLIEEVKPCSA